MRSNRLIAWTVPIAALLAASTSLQAQDRKPFWAGFLPSNDQVVVADEKGTLLLMSVPDLQVVREFVGMPDEDIERAALSPDGQWLAAHYGRDDLWVFDVGTGEVAHQLTHRDLRAGRITFAAGQIIALARGARVPVGPRVRSVHWRGHAIFRRLPHPLRHGNAPGHDQLAQRATPLRLRHDGGT